MSGSPNVVFRHQYEEYFKEHTPVKRSKFVAETDEVREKLKRFNLTYGWLRNEIDRLCGVKLPSAMFSKIMSGKYIHGREEEIIPAALDIVRLYEKKYYNAT